MPLTQLCNIIAQLCSMIIHSCPDDTLFIRYSCLTMTKRNEMLRDISTKIAPLFASGQSMTIRQLKKDDLNDGFYSLLEGYISHLHGREERFTMIALAQVLDEALKDLLLETIRAYQSEDFSVVLNTNRETTGIGLLPRCSCVWERKHRLFHSYHQLDHFLYHFLLIENSVLGELIDKHIFLPDGFFPDFAKERQLTVAATPLRREPHYVEEEYTKDDLQYLRIRYDLEQAGEDNQEIWKKIVTAGENHCDIIVFPELLGNSQTPEYTAQRLRALPAEEQKKMPSLIVLPSVWEKNMNTLTVLDRFGNIICRQSKQNPYLKEHDGTIFLENIRTNRVVSILHYEGIGRIAFLICKDFLTTKYMEQLMRCFKLTLIIVPSNSTGSYDFRQSFDLCAHDDCNVIWINTCAAMKRGKEDNFRNIGYVRKRIGRYDDDSQRLCEMPVCDGAFGGDCPGDCLYFETIRGV